MSVDLHEAGLPLASKMGEFERYARADVTGAGGMVS